MNSSQLAEIPLGWSIAGIAIILGLAVWTAIRYHNVGVFGLLAMPIAVLTQFAWWGFAPSWEQWFAVIATVILFITGMVVDRKIDDAFHYLALGCALILTPVLWIVVKTATATVNMNVPVIVLLVAMIVIVIGLVYLTKLTKRFRGRRSKVNVAAA